MEISSRQNLVEKTTSEHLSKICANLNLFILLLWYLDIFWHVVMNLVPFSFICANFEVSDSRSFVKFVQYSLFLRERN